LPERCRIVIVGDSTKNGGAKVMPIEEPWPLITSGNPAVSKIRALRDNATYVCMPIFGLTALFAMYCVFMFAFGGGTPSRISNGHYYIVDHQEIEVSESVYRRQEWLENALLRYGLPIGAIAAFLVFSNQRLLRGLADDSIIEKSRF